MEEEKAKNSPFCRVILVLSIIPIGFQIGYIFTVLNPLVVTINELYNSTYQKRYGDILPVSEWTTLLSLTVSMVIAGGFCGSLSVSYVLKHLTRKQTILLLSVLEIVGTVIISAASGITGSWEAFIVGRFVIGLGIGLGLNTAPVVIAEYCAEQMRSTYQSMLGLFISTGAVIGPIISHPKVLGTIDRWPAAIALGCVFPLIYISAYYWIPETPFMLLRKNDREEAVKVLTKLRIGNQKSIAAEISLMDEEQSGFSHASAADSVRQGKIKIVSIKGIFKNNQYRRQLLLAITLYSGLMLVGINHAVFYSDLIFINAGIPHNVVTYVTIGVFTAQALASLVGMKVIGIVGSRKLILWTIALAALAHTITTASLATKHLSPVSGYVSIVGILLFLMSVSSGPNLAVFALAGELTIEPTRQTVLNYSGGCLWLTSWLVGFSAPYLDEAIGAYSFLLWLGLTIIFWILIYRFIPETKGKTIAEIQRELQK